MGSSEQWRWSGRFAGNYETLSSGGGNGYSHTSSKIPSIHPPFRPLRPPSLSRLHIPTPPFTHPLLPQSELFPLSYFASQNDRGAVVSLCTSLINGLSRLHGIRHTRGSFGTCQRHGCFPVCQ